MKNQPNNPALPATSKTEQAKPDTQPTSTTEQPLSSEWIANEWITEAKRRLTAYQQGDMPTVTRDELGL